MIRTGVIGYGLGGMAFHAPLIHAVPELELAAIVTSRAEQVKAAYPEVAVVADAAALFADPSIRLVAISTPNDSHFPLAKAALEAGKHVVIDKPFTNKVAEGEELVALAGARGLVLAAFHNRRWDADFLTVRKLLDSGRLGDVMLAESRWDRFRPEVTGVWRERPEAGSGILADLGPHLIDQALLLFGMPEALTADIAAQRPGGQTDDYYEIALHYGARRVILSSSRLVAKARPRFSLHGTGGSFVKYGLDPQEPWMKAGGSANDPGFGVEDAGQYGVLTRADGSSEVIASERGDYRLFYSGIGQAIADGTAPPVTAVDAVAGLRLMELARQSAREGRRVSI
jgi:scyllo-inositol 2-dehydrogenase (NADP+)